MALKKRILVAQLKEKSRALLQDLLVSSYNVVLASSGEETLQLAREEKPDLILLDMFLPRENGLQICKFLRKSTSTKNIPIIILSDPMGTSDRVAALESGADDLISKPFDPDELIARINCKIGRFSSLLSVTPVTEIERGNLRMNLLTRQIRIGQDHVYLTGIEFDIVRSLLEAKSFVRSRKQLIDDVWNEVGVPARILDSHILAIRRKLTKFDRSIETVYGNGYVIRDP